MRFSKMLRLFSHRESGQTLVEILVAVAILGITAVTFFSGFTTSSDIVFSVDERETGKNIAESQLEYVKSQTYAASYVPDIIPDEYAGYSANITVSSIASRDGNIQKVTVIIKHQDKEVAHLEGYKVN
jgi:prepilin-type N-terminal cleavage/methylation domain-containing protein